MTREVGRWGGVRAAGVGVLVAGAAAVLAACGSSGSDADVVAGKQLFVSKCGACHTLGRAGTKGTVGPNLDQAFQQAVKDGMGRDGIEGAVKEQIAYPRAHSQMPPSSSRATRPSTSPSTSRPRPPAAARTRAGWPRP